jgi:hypothetical protein
VGLALCTGPGERGVGAIQDSQGIGSFLPYTQLSSVLHCFEPQLGPWPLSIVLFLGVTPLLNLYGQVTYQSEGGAPVSTHWVRLRRDATVADLIAEVAAQVSTQPSRSQAVQGGIKSSAHRQAVSCASGSHVHLALMCKPDPAPSVGSGRTAAPTTKHLCSQCVAGWASSTGASAAVAVSALTHVLEGTVRCCSPAHASCQPELVPRFCGY